MKKTSFFIEGQVTTRGQEARQGATNQKT